MHRSVEAFGWLTRRGRKVNGVWSTLARATPVLQWGPSSPEPGKSITPTEAVQRCGFRVAELATSGLYTNISSLEDAIQWHFMELPLGQRLWRTVAGCPVTDGPGDEKIVKLFIIYSWEIHAMIASGEVAIVHTVTG